MRIIILMKFIGIFFVLSPVIANAQEWEYPTVGILEELQEESLNLLGKNGWELVSSRQSIIGEGEYRKITRTKINRLIGELDWIEDDVDEIINYYEVRINESEDLKLLIVKLRKLKDSELSRITELTNRILEEGEAEFRELNPARSEGESVGEKSKLKE